MSDDTTTAKPAPAGDLLGRWALVTGGSSGIGVDFARELAKRGANCILVARREDRLREVADSLRTDFDVEVEIKALDIGTRDGVETLYDWTLELGHPVDILVNNAGFGIYGDFLEIPWESELAMLELDIVTLVDLTKRFARDMVARGFGRILQVASIGAYQSTPTYASYSAAKSFVLHFSEAINYELRGTGVTCTVVSPGVTKTRFLEVAGQKPTLYQRLFMMKSPRVARIGIKAMLRGRAHIIPGFLNSLVAWSARLMPRWVITRVAYLAMRE